PRDKEEREKGLPTPLMVDVHHSRGLSDSQQCRSNHGHCRRLCFHMERWEGTCSNGRLRCCR
uniref:Beta-defensin-like domain-containing protein n=1 Tax=Falco tinnunculus TaxID=100819 RepID=A0A8C4TV32_FALTI